ncbi:hypothetical protein [Vibrio diabolicus]
MSKFFKPKLSGTFFLPSSATKLPVMAEEVSGLAVNVPSVAEEI